MKKKKSKNRLHKGHSKQQQAQSKAQKKKVGRIEKQEIKGEKGNYRHFIGLGIIILLGIIIYSNSFDCTFHFDDARNIIENTIIRDLSDVKSLWNHGPTRFVSFYSFALNYHFGELNVWGYHLGNLIIHLINACLIYWLTLLIFSSPTLKGRMTSQDTKLLAFITALLFVSHPLATQSVVYIVQRMASLVALFYLLSLSLYMKARLIDKNNLSKYLFFGGAITAAILAMLTKENAFTLPLAILLFEIFFLQTKKLSVSFKDYRFIILVGGLLGFILLLVSSFSMSIFNPVFTADQSYQMTPLKYLFTQFSVIVKYIQLLLVPVGQNIDHDIAISNSFFELRTIISFLLLSSLIVLAIFLFKKNRLISFSIFWFFLTLAIESSIIPIIDVIFEHRTYLPSFGFFLILSWGIYKLLWSKHKYLAMAIVLLIIGSNSILTYKRNNIWKDMFTLWDDSVSKSPEKARPYVNRGLAYYRSNQNAKAIADYKRAIEISPRYFEAYFNRALAYGKEEGEKAILDYTKAIEIRPRFALVYNNRGTIYKNLQQWDKAADDFSKAIELDPKYARAFNKRGSIYDKLKQWNKAADDFSKAIELDPNYTEAYTNLGIAYMGLKQWDRAIDVNTKAIKINPKYYLTYHNLGIVYLNLKQWNNAIDVITKAIELNPNFSNLYNNRGVAYVNLEQWNKALLDFNKAFEIDPNDATARLNSEHINKRLNSEKN